MIKNLPDWIKYIGMVMLLFGVPVILNNLATEYEGYLFKIGDWYFLGLPTIVFLWWAVLFFWHRHFNYQQKIERFLDKLQQQSPEDLSIIFKEASERVCRDPKEGELEGLRREYVLETILQEHAFYRMTHQSKHRNSSR